MITITDLKTPFPFAFLSSIREIEDLYQLCGQLGEGTFNQCLILGDFKSHSTKLEAGRCLGKTNGGDHLIWIDQKWYLENEHDYSLTLIGDSIASVLTYISSPVFMNSQKVFFISAVCSGFEAYYPNSVSLKIAAYLNRKMEGSFLQGGSTCFYSKSLCLFLTVERLDVLNDGREYGRIFFSYPRGTDLESWGDFKSQLISLGLVEQPSR
ncbi:MAG: hypothetical protein P1U86_02190 [Verrucomicrobiales bacterium]|nr:hypothetical protein [Verrucomicrobiales bacterium]